MTGTNNDGGGGGDATGVAGDGRGPTGAKVAGLLILGVVFAVLAALTWRKWPDPIIDFGTQLYIPWRITQGAVLYRDLYYFAGSPLSQYFNALLFKIFGVSYTTLIAANLVFSAALLWFVYRRFMVVSNVLTATMICLGIEVAFVFSEFIACGNYNFIAPYSHEALHGLILSLLVMGLMSDWLARPRLWLAGLAGFCAGLIFLTKPDIFLAMSAGVATAFGLHWLGRREIRFALKSLACFGAAMLVPVLFFFLLFLRVEDWRMSLRSVVFGWVPLFTPAVRNNKFYVEFRGMDFPLLHIEQMVTEFFWAALVIGGYAVFFRGLVWWRPGRSQNLKWVLWALALAPLLNWAFHYAWYACASSLPFWCLTIMVLLGWQLKKTPLSLNHAFPFIWSVFALLLLSKLGVNVRLWHCGFILAMPATVVTIYFLLWLFPAWLDGRYGVPTKYLRTMFLVTLLVAFGVLVKESKFWYHAKNLSIGSNGDRILILGPEGRTGKVIQSALSWVEENTPTNATLAVLPSGINLNYLSRRVNSTPSLFWDPNSMAVFDQAKMTSGFVAAPPDYVLVLEQDQDGFGVGYLGSYPGYGVALMQWIKQHYKSVVIIGHEPLKNGLFGAQIYQRIAPAK